MRPRNIFLIAVLLLIAKAFFLDEYLAKHKSTDVNSSDPVTQVTPEPEVKPEPVAAPEPHENNLTAVEPDKNSSDEDKKMPLDRLGDSLTSHIKL